MKGIRDFLYKATAHFRWRYFSWKRMCLLSLLLFLFFIGWRILLQDEAAQEFTLPRLIRHMTLAIFMGFLYAFSKIPKQNKTIYQISDSRWQISNQTSEI